MRKLLRALGPAAPAVGPRAGAGAVARWLGQQAQDRPSSSYWHQPGTEPLLYITLGELVERAANRFGDRDAVVSVHEDTRLTYSQLLDQVDRAAAGYRTLGLESGDRVAIWGPNSWKWIVSRLGAARAGLIPVDLNPRYREPEVAHCLRLTGASAVVAAEGHRGLRYDEILAAIPHATEGLKTFITLSDTPVPGALQFSELLSSVNPECIQEIRNSQCEVSPDDPCNILFSSGTTGDPKAVVLRHMGVVNTSYSTGKRLQLQDKHHKLCLLMPLFTVGASVSALTTAIHFGVTVVIPSEEYDPQRSVEAIRREKCSFLVGTPTLFLDLLRVVEESGEPLKYIDAAISGGAPLTPELFYKTMSTLGIKRMCGVYGMSETSAVTFQMQPTDSIEVMAQTVGKVGDHIEVKVVDRNGRTVPFGCPGELLVRGYLIMKEYFRNEDATQKAVVDGWFKTGDQFVLQKDGYGRVVGRLKDMILRGGENIYPAEIEKVLSSHPDIIEAQVVGVPDERMGEEACACLRVRDDTKITATELRHFCAGKIANSKIPRYSVIMQEFPQLLSGKVPKRVLRDQCEELLKRKELDDSRSRP